MEDHLRRFRVRLRQRVGRFYRTQETAFNRRFIARLREFTLKGKLLRGVLVMLGNEMEGGQGGKSVLNAAAALELTHSGLLIHDDIMDHDQTRRGMPTIHRLWGEGLAIAWADWLFYQAIGLLDNASGLPELFSRAIQATASGQIMDVYYGQAKTVPDQETILEIYRQKTARYSFSLPLQIGARLAHCSPTEENRLGQLGECLGLIFQIRDDDIGLYADAETSGKPIGSDIRENKKTLWRTWLYARSSPAERARLDKVFGQAKLRQKQITAVIDQIDKQGVRSRIEQTIDDLSGRAERIINQLHCDRRYRHLLLELLVHHRRRQY